MPHGIYPAKLADAYVADAGQQWTPSNGTEGEIFLSSWCGNCAHDTEMSEGGEVTACNDGKVCDIIARSFCGTATEWQYGQDGQPCCIKFWPKEKPLAIERCLHTPDMFPREIEAAKQAPLKAQLQAKAAITKARLKAKKA